MASIGKKILGAAGMRVEQAPTEVEQARQHKSQQAIIIWGWLRTQLDIAIEEYLKSESDDRLKKICGQGLYDQLIRELDTIKAADLFWSFPNRDVESEPTWRVVNIEGIRDNPRRQPSAFTIQESFTDNSVLTHGAAGGGPVSHAGGARRIIEATVQVLGVQEYKISEVRRVSFGE